MTDPTPQPDDNPTPEPDDDGAEHWYDELPPDLKNNPTVQKYGSVEEQVKGHLELQKQFGGDKVVWPKDEKDPAWNKIHEKLGVPQAADGYKLNDVKTPEEFKGMSFDKQTFAQKMHELKVPAGQASKMWDAYTGMVLESYQKAHSEYTAKAEEAKANLMKEWGAAFESNTALANNVIKSVARDKDQMDFLTATLLADPKGVKFLAEIGGMFSEHQVGTFQEANFTLTPNQAREKMDEIMADKSHDYWSDNQAKREKAVEYVLGLRKMASAGQ